MSLERDYNAELYHFGIKGQKWGVRRYQNKDGSLTNAGKKRVNKVEQKETKAKVAKGAKKAAKVLGKIGNAYITDQLFFGGVGTAATKAVVNTMGRATITAYTMARGGYDIKWYDKQGRRVG